MRVSNEILQQIAWYEQEICKEWGYVQVIAVELRELKDEMQKFLDFYYKEVGIVYDRLKSLKRRLKAPVRTEGKRGAIFFIPESGETALPTVKSMAPTLLDLLPKREEDEHLWVDIPAYDDKTKQQAAKNIYRKLVKWCHPDTSGFNGISEDLFMCLKDAFEENDIETLLSMQQAILDMRQPRAETPMDKLYRMEAQYDAALSMKDALLLKRHNILRSPAYELLQRAEQEDFDGGDLIEEIREGIVQQVQEIESVLERYYPGVITEAAY